MGRAPEKVPAIIPAGGQGGRISDKCHQALPAVWGKLHRDIPEEFGYDPNRNEIYT
jgi:hypothetical protein